MGLKIYHLWKQCILSQLNMRYHYLNIILYNTIFNNLKRNTIYYEANKWMNLLLPIRRQKVPFFSTDKTKGKHWQWWVYEPLSRTMTHAVSNRWTPSYDSVKVCITTERSNEHDYSITKGFSYKISHHRVSLKSIFPLWV